jgi:hypothetical protein
MFQGYQDRGSNTADSYARCKLPGRAIYSSGQKKGQLAKKIIVHIEDLIVSIICVHRSLEKVRASNHKFYNYCVGDTPIVYFLMAISQLI